MKSREDGWEVVLQHRMPGPSRAAWRVQVQAARRRRSALDLIRQAREAPRRQRVLGATPRSSQAPGASRVGGFELRRDGAEGRLQPYRPRGARERRQGAEGHPTTSNRLLDPPRCHSRTAR